MNHSLTEWIICEIRFYELIEVCEKSKIYEIVREWFNNGIK